MHKLYLKSPHYIQNLAISTYGYFINRKRYSSMYQKAFDELTRNNFTSNEQLVKYHNNKFSMLIGRIKANKSYKKRFNFLYGEIDNFKLLEDILSLPILEKKKVRECLALYPIDPKKEMISKSSGAIGDPLIMPQSEIADAYKWATWWRYRNNNGISFNEKCGYFGARIIAPKSERKNFFRYNHSSNQYFFSLYHLNNDTVIYYWDIIRKKNISWLHGFPSILVHFASLLLEKNVFLEHQVEIISIGSESLLPNQRKILSDCFNCRIIQHYGLSEAVVNISEDKEKNLLIDEDFSYVELLPDKESDKKRLIGSTLFNECLPLFRYDTRDLVVDSGDKIGTSRKIDELHGRSDDYLVLQDGSKLTMLGNIFREIPSIKEAQIRQYSVNQVVFFIVTLPYFSKVDNDKLIEEIKLRINGRINFDIRYVDKITRTHSGKLRLVVSDL